MADPVFSIRYKMYHLTDKLKTHLSGILNCDFYKLTCSVQLTLFFKNSTNLSTTPGVCITSSIGGLGSEMGKKRVKLDVYTCVWSVTTSWLVPQICWMTWSKQQIPLESSFLNFCVVASWSSGSSEKSISTMSLVMTPSCNNTYTSALNTQVESTLFANQQAGKQAGQQ